MKTLPHIPEIEKGRISESEWTPEKAVTDSMNYIERLSAENEELKREVEKMKIWKEKYYALKLKKYAK